MSEEFKYQNLGLGEASIDLDGVSGFINITIRVKPETFKILSEDRLPMRLFIYKEEDKQLIATQFDIRKRRNIVVEL